MTEEIHFVDYDSARDRLRTRKRREDVKWGVLFEGTPQEVGALILRLKGKLADQNPAKRRQKKESSFQK